MNKYPIYIPSKGRADKCTTAQLLKKEGIRFHLVVEAPEASAYSSNFGDDVLVLPFEAKGSVIRVRNWIKEHAHHKEESQYHWQIDDDLKKIVRVYRGKKIACPFGVALTATEDLVDRFSNVAMAGLRSGAFVGTIREPFSINQCIYGVYMMRSDLPNKFRTWNEDNDMSLQVLTEGWCTIIMNVFAFEGGGETTGGNTDKAYGSGREVKDFLRLWPAARLSKDKKRVVVSHLWKMFPQRPEYRDDLDLPEGFNNFGMKLVRKKEIKSERINKIWESSK